MAIIYKIRNIINNKLYIGSTNDKDRRWNRHKWSLRTGQHHNNALQRAWDKYGEKNFAFEVIEECADEEQFIREQYYLDLLKPFVPDGYNFLEKANEITHDNKGENHSRAKLTNKEVIEIKKILASGISQKELVDITGISWGTIGKIASVCRWKNVGAEYNEQLLSLQRGKWKDEYIDEVIALREEGLTFKTIGERMNFDATTLNEKYNKHLGKDKVKYCENCKCEIPTGTKAKYCLMCRGTGNKAMNKYCKECGAEIKNSKPRQKYCDICKEKISKKKNKLRQLKYRAKRKATM